MLKDVDIAPEDPAELRAVNRLLADEVKALTLVEQLQHQLHGHNRHRFGSKAEGSDQLNLTFVEDEQIADARDQANPSSKSTQHKPPRQHSRKPLPDHLDREDEVLSPGECGRCGGSLKTVGEDVTEELEYVPGCFKVKRIIRPRMAFQLRGICPGSVTIASNRAWQAGTGAAGPCSGRSTRITCHYIASPRSTPVKASILIAPRWRIGWADARPCWSPWQMRSVHRQAWRCPLCRRHPGEDAGSRPEEDQDGTGLDPR